LFILKAIDFAYGVIASIKPNLQNIDSQNTTDFKIKLNFTIYRQFMSACINISNNIK